MRRTWRRGIFGTERDKAEGDREGGVMAEALGRELLKEVKEEGLDEVGSGSRYFVRMRARPSSTSNLGIIFTHQLTVSSC